MRVLAALSGGVDSSVAAALMVGEGHDVVGVTLKLWEGPHGEAPTAGCCTVSDAEDARRVAAQLDIPYYVLNYMEEFKTGIVDRFITDYATGRTPNPCIECNRVVKFDLLLTQAAQLGCELVVTGHYARVRSTGDRYSLLRGVDPQKDQSYVLYMLGQEELARVRFPVGELTKTETRNQAAELGLRTAAKVDSQDICFVGDRDYRDFLREQAPALARAGAIVDTEGRVIGDHAGVIDFTVGQRKGLGVAFGDPRYVVGIRPWTQTVVVGRREALLVERVEITDTSWVSGRPPVDGKVQAQVRAHSRPVTARLTAGHVVSFNTPQAAIAPGQAAVLYAGEQVLGGGTIADTGM